MHCLKQVAARSTRKVCEIPIGKNKASTSTNLGKKRCLRQIQKTWPKGQFCRKSWKRMDHTQTCRPLRLRRTRLQTAKKVPKFQLFAPAIEAQQPRIGDG